LEPTDTRDVVDPLGPPRQIEPVPFNSSPAEQSALPRAPANVLQDESIIKQVESFEQFLHDISFEEDDPNEPDLSLGDTGNLLTQLKSPPLPKRPDQQTMPKPDQMSETLHPAPTIGADHDDAIMEPPTKEQMNPETNSSRGQIPKKQMPQAPQGQWADGPPQVRPQSSGHGGKGKGKGKGDRYGPNIEMDFKDQLNLQSPSINEFIRVNLIIAPKDMENFVFDPRPRETTLPDGKPKTEKYRRETLSLSGFGAASFLKTVIRHMEDTGIEVHSTNNLSIDRSSSPKPPWTIEVKIRTKDRFNFMVYTELLHRQNHTITVFMLDSQNVKHKIDFRITAQEDIRSSERSVTFTARWMNHPEWAPTWDGTIRLLQDLEWRRQQVTCPPVLDYTDPENPITIATGWTATRGVKWHHDALSNMLIPEKTNQYHLTIPIRYLEACACRDWHQSLPMYAQIPVKNPGTKEEKVVRADVTITDISGISINQMCKLSRVTHNLDLSREHQIPYKPNTEAEPCLKCRIPTDPMCQRCFQTFGIPGSTHKERQEYHEKKDRHDCQLKALQNLAKQTTSLGRTAAAHLEEYIPMVSAPAVNLRNEKPSEEQIKLAEAELQNPMYLEQIELEARAYEAAAIHHNLQKAQKQTRTQEHQGYMEKRSNKRAKNSLNPGIPTFKNPQTLKRDRNEN